MNKQKIPIWLADVTVISKSGKTFIIKKIVCKGKNETELMANPEVLLRCKMNIKGGKKLLDSLTIKSIRLISQHGYGPKEFDYVEV